MPKDNILAWSGLISMRNAQASSEQDSYLFMSVLHQGLLQIVFENSGILRVMNKYLGIVILYNTI